MGHFPDIPGKSNPTADPIRVLQDLGRCGLVLWVSVLGKNFLEKRL